MENKYCITCLSEGKISICFQECNNSEHQNRFPNKANYSEQINTLIDKKINEVVALVDMITDVYGKKNTKK